MDDFLRAPDRRDRPGTLVSHVVHVNEPRHSMLPVEHRDVGLHLPAGGQVGPDEDPADTALREVREEVGIETSLPPGIGASHVMAPQTTTVS
jgi:8-oxo-dGTP diphosphatase